MKTVSKIIIGVALAASIAARPAFAWGDREQGIVAGTVGLWTIQQLSRIGQSAYPAYPHSPVYQPPVVPYYPHPTGYTHRPMYRAVDLFIPECNCYRTVMVQIN